MASRKEKSKELEKRTKQFAVQIIKEASETQYWLEVAVEAEMLPWMDVKPVYEECSELLAIFTASYSTSKRSQISQIS